jgi:hypothetical protein
MVETLFGRILLTTPRQARRLVVIVVGFTVLIIGVALLVLPGPAVVVIPIGLAILATEFVWAGRLLHRMKQAAGRVGSVFTGRAKNSQHQIAEDRERFASCEHKANVSEDNRSRISDPS